MTISMTSDYRADKGCPQPYLRRIAEAGFSHLHWCHHWDDDFVYGRDEIAAIKSWLREYGLTLNDVHASCGVEKRWFSALEYERAEGVELVRNRIAMTAELGADVIVMHAWPCSGENEEDFFRQLWRSLDDLEPFAREHGVRIALENGLFPIISAACLRYSGDYVGICYDCGHGNLDAAALGLARALAERIIAVHLHDNDGKTDKHWPPFRGTVDWEAVAGLIAASPYRKPVNLESNMHQCGDMEEADFLEECRAGAERIAGMIETARAGT